ncbi:helix-hairpin-helix domain-containing protein [Listeria rocourtiae]|nr:helix-hairpin-helix domain-containing protein [Listeria rocourtiae]EUJ42886.1 hypothetical protein PROCOU_16378 [Listeria rocourtiae FSL F6-920]
MTNLPNIGKPATNALRQLDITTLEQIAIHDEKNAFKKYMALDQKQSVF